MINAKSSIFMYLSFKETIYGIYLLYETCIYKCRFNMQDIEAYPHQVSFISIFSVVGLLAFEHSRRSRRHGEPSFLRKEAWPLYVFCKERVVLKAYVVVKW